MPDTPSFDESMARGVEGYLKHRIAEAAEYFEKAVALQPDSVQAHLALGTVRLALYVRRPSPISSYPFAERDISMAELKALQDAENAILAEENSTNWPLAEKSLKQANQLDPNNSLVVEYLCALYFNWKDPHDERNDRVYETKHWLERLLELRPEHAYANFCCGTILSVKARKLMPNYGRYPPVSESDLPSLRMQVTPLLEEASRHLERACALSGQRTVAAHMIGDIKSMQAYLADPETASRKLIGQLMKSLPPEIEAENLAMGAAEPSRPSASITFSLSPEAIAEDRERPFPPNPWRIGVGPKTR